MLSTTYVQSFNVGSTSCADLLMRLLGLTLAGGSGDSDDDPRVRQLFLSIQRRDSGTMRRMIETDRGLVRSFNFFLSVHHADVGNERHETKVVAVCFSSKSKYILILRQQQEEFFCAMYIVFTAYTWYHSSGLDVILIIVTADSSLQRFHSPGLRQLHRGDRFDGHTAGAGSWPGTQRPQRTDSSPECNRRVGRWEILLLAMDAERMTLIKGNDKFERTENWIPMELVMSDCTTP